MPLQSGQHDVKALCSLAERINSHRFSDTGPPLPVIITEKEDLIMEKVKLRIAELRHRNNITQQQLAEIVGVSFQTVSKWENGSRILRPE